MWLLCGGLLNLSMVFCVSLSTTSLQNQTSSETNSSTFCKHGSGGGDVEMSGGAALCVSCSWSWRVFHGRVCWGLKDRRSLTVSLPLLPPAGDPSRCGCVQGEAENPNGRRYEKPHCWCVTAQCCEASSSSLVKYVTCSSEHVTSAGSPGRVAVLQTGLFLTSWTSCRRHCTRGRDLKRIFHLV